MRFYESILCGDESPRYLQADLEGLLARSLKLSSPCRLCGHECLAERGLGEAGWCGVLESRVSSLHPHYGEEDFLVPSLTVFFTGCNFDCVYCQNADISGRPEAGVRYNPGELAELIRGFEFLNINWVGGDPTPHIPYILEVLGLLDVEKPQVFNTNMYLSQDAMDVVVEFADMFLTDLKYGSNKCGRLSGVEDYYDVVPRNHAKVYGRSDLLIRHLVLPGHVECCSKPVLDWISENTPDAVVNVMSQYRPMNRADEFTTLSRRVDPNEVKEAREHAHKLGLRTC